MMEMCFVNFGNDETLDFSEHNAPSSFQSSHHEDIFLEYIILCLLGCWGKNNVQLGRIHCKN